MRADAVPITMDLARLRELVRHQHLRGVEMVQIDEDQHHVRIRIPPADPLGRHAVPATSAPPEPDDCLTVRSEALGIFRRTHPQRLPTAIGQGDGVQEGQLLALLQLGDVLIAVNAPAAAVVQTVLADEGQRIDYGMPLFRLTSGRR